MNQPIFIASVFIKVLAWALIIAVAGLVAVILFSGHISTLDLFGTLITAIIIAYIVHLWIYYARGSKEED
jgi:membrane protein DedA with SNARE-associated domain